MNHSHNIVKTGNKATNGFMMLLKAWYA